jgi:flagellar biosynthesis protein FlhF
MREIQEGLQALKQEQAQVSERTVTAVVSAVAPAVNAVTNVVHLAGLSEEAPVAFPELYDRLVSTGVAESLARELIQELPSFDAWSEEARPPLAHAALRDILSRRVASCGPIELTPGKLKAVALIGPTGVGKTTTIAKLAAHFTLVENKRVALLTMDTYRIAAVEQLKTYSQIIDIPISVAYDQSDVLPAIAQFADFDLLLIDTAGRSQKNIMQVGELKAMLEMVRCETHLALSAPVKEQDMLETIHRFSAARVDRLIFSKLDETSSYGTLLNVADRSGIPLSYLTTGQRVPEDIETANGRVLADLILG